ncbi:hypothetical protein N0V88_006368 [Collariella sp. IMI 366227]|nr:hypothetical protein N0V88_006368 [Collariella sp. IMI 366227]
MHTPLLFRPGTPFHAGSFAPAVNLVEDLPQGINANVLLLSCGDVRNILYTAYAERGFPPRLLDYTACDVDENALARNILLFTLLLDSPDTVTPIRLWNVYYDFYLDDADRLLVCNQAQKLLCFARTLDDWHTSPYGTTLRFCDEGTLSLVRRVWEQYADSLHFDEAHWEPFERALSATKTRTSLSQETNEADVARSCAPVASELASELVIASRQHWERALACPVPLTSPKAKTRSAHPNPVFAIPLMGSSTLEYPTDPLLSFHLAAGCVPLAQESPLQPQDDPEIYPGAKNDRLARTAMVQFTAWTEAFKNSSLMTIIRFTASDCLAFCCTLRHCRDYNRKTYAKLYRRSLGFDVLTLADSEYGSGGQAPTSFDIIDTSTLCDNTGTLNLLVSAAPLLAPLPSAILYTQGAYNTSDSRSFENLLEGHTTTLSALLGLVPAEYWTNAKAASTADEATLAVLAQNSTTSKYQGIIKGNRLAWKHSRYVSGQLAKGFCLRTSDLAGLIFSVYVNALRTVGPNAITHNTKTILPRYGSYLQHNTLSTVALLYALSASVHTDVVQTAQDLVSLISGSASESTARQHLYSLLTYMAFPPNWSPKPSVVEIDHEQYGFQKWKEIPAILAISVVVPTESWKEFSQEEIQNLRLPGTYPPLMSAHVKPLVGEHGVLGTETPSTFSDIQISFGTVTAQSSRDNDNFKLFVDEDKAAWKGDSPMIVSFFVPLDLLKDIRMDDQIGLHARRTALDTDGFLQAEDQTKVVFETSFANLNKVFVTKYRPNHAGHEMHDGVLQSQRDWPVRTKSPAPEPGFTPCLENADIVSVTGHLDIASDRGKELLASKAPITLEQTSPFTINIVFGKKDLVLPLIFPIPVLAKGSSTRIARTSGYIEVIAPLAKPSASPPILDDFIFPPPSTPHHQLQS